MAVFYQGKRPVLKGRNGNQDIHTWKNQVGVYSNWSLMNPSHVLDGAPNEHHVPGTGRHPHGFRLSQEFTGLRNAIQPLKAPGLGYRYDRGRYGPLQYKGLPGSNVFRGSFGHAIDTPVVTGGQSYSYSNFKFDGVPSAEKLKNAGHGARGINAPGTANTFGRFDPWNVDARRVGEIPLKDSGQAPVEGYSNPYGHNKVNEWRGTPSSKAL